MLALTTCISWRNAGRQRKRGRLVKPMQQPKPRWQQPQYHPTKEDELTQTAHVSSTSDRCLGGAGQEPSISCEGHTSLLQWGQARWFGEANPRHMERGLEGKGPTFADPILSHSPAKSQKPPSKGKGFQDKQVLAKWRSGAFKM